MKPVSFWSIIVWFIVCVRVTQIICLKQNPEYDTMRWNNSRLNLVPDKWGHTTQNLESEMQLQSAERWTQMIKADVAEPVLHVSLSSKSQCNSATNQIQV